jgi:hypothetical protein
MLLTRDAASANATREHVPDEDIDSSVDTEQTTKRYTK